MGPAAESSSTCPRCGSEHGVAGFCPAATPRPPGTFANALELPSKAGPDDSLDGQRVGNFQIERLIGRGGMGSVYLGVNPAIGSRVAIKFLHERFCRDASVVGRFFDEARAVNLIGHENIVSIFDFGLLPPERHYLVMEYLEGQPLASLLGSPVEAAAALRILAQICDALEAAHAREIVHRDLKPENVFLVTRSGMRHFVKLVDFGIAQLGVSTGGGAGLGSPESMAPEQWRCGPVDARTDLYAVGVLAYALATGRMPFREPTASGYCLAHTTRPPEPPRNVNNALSPAFEALILRALAKRPEARFQDAREMAKAIAEALAQLTGPTPAASPPSRPSASAAAPAPRDSQPALSASLEWPGGTVLQRVPARDLSAGGVFVCHAGTPPPLMSRLRVSLERHGGRVDLEADVVRHVSAAEAASWKTEAGFALQFVAGRPEQRAAITALMQGGASASAVAGSVLDPDGKAAKLAERCVRRGEEDFYGMLDLQPDADCADVAPRVRQMLRELTPLREQGTVSQRELAQLAQLRVRRAAEILGTPQRRAEFDAANANFRGVARCLAAGMRVDEVEALRRRFLAGNPAAEARSRIEAVRADALVGSGDFAGAINGLEMALRRDPLNLELHGRYWGLKRKSS